MGSSPTTGRRVTRPVRAKCVEGGQRDAPAPEGRKRPYSNPYSSYCVAFPTATCAERCVRLVPSSPLAFPPRGGSNKGRSAYWDVGVTLYPRLLSPLRTGLPGSKHTHKSGDSLEHIVPASGRPGLTTHHSVAPPRMGLKVGGACSRPLQRPRDHVHHHIAHVAASNQPHVSCRRVSGACRTPCQSSGRQLVIPSQDACTTPIKAFQ